MLETPPPKGQAAWDGMSLAKALGVSKTSVYAVEGRRSSSAHAQQMRQRRPGVRCEGGEHRRSRPNPVLDHI